MASSTVINTDSASTINTPTVASQSTISPSATQSQVQNSPSQAPAVPLPPLALFQNLTPITVILERNNYSFWKPQVLPAVRAHELEDNPYGVKACLPRYVD